MRCKHATHTWNPSWALMRISLALPGFGREINKAVIWIDNLGYLNTSSGHWGFHPRMSVRATIITKYTAFCYKYQHWPMFSDPELGGFKKWFIKKKQREWEDFSYMPYLLPERAKGHVQYLVACWRIIQVRRCHVVLSDSRFTYSIGWSHLHWLPVWVNEQPLNQSSFPRHLSELDTPHLSGKILKSLPEITKVEQKAGD